MRMTPFEVIDWPPGRACSECETEEIANYSWACVTDSDGEVLFAVQLADLLSSLSKTNRIHVQSEVYSLLERAKQGKCTPVEWGKDGKRTKPGVVDRMGYRKADILELIVHRKLPGNPKMCLRLYFVEPTSRHDLLVISARTKPATKEGKKEQDLHWKEAEKIVHEWWIS